MPNPGTGDYRARLPPKGAVMRRAGPGILPVMQVWLSLVERLLAKQKIVGSNPTTCSESILGLGPESKE